MHPFTIRLIALFAVAVPAQVVNLHGTISTRSGKPIAGAIVSLTGLPFKDTTGTDGAYLLSNSTSIRTYGDRSLRLEGGVLSFWLDSSMPVDVVATDLEGRRMGRQRLVSASMGAHSLRMVDPSRTPGVFLLRATFGDQTHLLRCVTLGHGRFAIGTESANPARSNALARAAALPDTLRVSATGFLARALSLSGYDQTLDVQLDSLATCNPADKTADPVAVGVSNTGAALTGTHQVVVETDPTLAGRTIYRPKDLAPGKNYPVLIWGNGGCSLNATDHTDFHLEIASHGYVIISDGTPKGTGNRDMVDVTTLGAPQIQALTWGIQQNAKPCSRFYKSLDTVHVAGFGWSCGGIMTYGLSLDPRIFTSIIMSSGLLTADQTTLDKIHAPIAYVCGGSTDIAYDNCKRDYTNMKTVPTIFANDPVGHGGTYYSDNGGEFAKIAIAWFDWWLKADTTASAKGKFSTPDGQFAKSPWTLETKRLP